MSCSFLSLLLLLNHLCVSLAEPFSLDDYTVIANKRIRREIRDLSTDQWNRVAAALNTMKRVNQSEGEALYGKYFLNYDAMERLLVQHNNIRSENVNNVETAGTV